jgi:hypothetical protein
MGTHDIVQRLKNEGWQEATQTVLLTIYRTRFGAVPRKLRAAVERNVDDAVLAAWIEIFVIRSAAEIAAIVTPKNGVATRRGTG